MYIGKDGGKYKTYYDKEAADRRYEQNERLIKETQNQNRLLELQDQRLKNGGLTDTEKYCQMGANLANSASRIAPFYLILTLLIGGVIVCQFPNIGLYIISSGFFIEGMSVFFEKNRKGQKHVIYEFIMFLIGILLIVITFLPLGTLKTFLPIDNSNIYTLIRGTSDYKYQIKISRLIIDGEDMYHKDNIELDKNKVINIEVEYYESGNSKEKHTDKIVFNPQEYFSKIENECTIKDFDKLNKFYLLKYVISGTY